MVAAVRAQSADAEALVRAARDLAPLLRAAGDEIEAARTLTPAVVEAMRVAGVFRMAMPRAWGGPEADPLTQIRVTEAIAHADGSAGWCAAIGCDGGFVSSYLDQDVAREMWADLDAPTAFVLKPSGRATPVAGGYRVSGRWSFGSGSRHSAWLASGCLTLDGDGPRPSPAGTPEVRVCVFPAADVTSLDTWRTTGLRGSGSHDYAVEDRFVPEERTFTFGTTRPRRPGPLYARPSIFVLKGCGVPLGIGRRAIDEVIALTGRKAAPGGKGPRDEAYVQAAVGRAEALVGSARSFVFDAVGEFWAALVAGDQPAPAQRARAMLAGTNAVTACVAAVDLMYQAAGGEALYATSPLDRCLRDIHTLGQHVAYGPKTYEGAGGLLLGLEPAVSLL